MTSLNYQSQQHSCLISDREHHTLLSEMTSEEFLVTIPQGILKGQKEISPLGDEYYGFQGIPYAKPPLGELRFKSPQPAEGWAGIRDATKGRGIAPHIDFLTGELINDSDEDCLYLHIYTKELPQTGTNKPVLVWIHGGGFTVGSGNKDIYSPDYFMSHDIVFVSINYRLGALGFLSLKTVECPGNFGLKDQNLALRWVQQNITHFGGNPDNVTIFGESAGAASVHYHLQSPSSKGLFKRAISQSAASVNPWGFARQPRESAYLLGKRLGFNAETDEELLAFLRKASVLDIIVKSNGILHEIEGERIGEKIDINFTFVPTSEPEHENAFITHPPLSQEWQLDIPFITGVTDKEMLMEIHNVTDIPKWTEDREFQELIPRNLNVQTDSELSIEIARKIRNFYFKNGITADGLIDVLSDTFFVHGVYRAVRHRIEDKNIISPTYLYAYSFDGKNAYMKLWLEKMLGKPIDIPGVAHADELGYLFTFKDVNMPVEIGSTEHKMILRFVKLWVDFATTGVPTNETAETKWPPIKTGNDAYLDIGKDFELKNGFFKERIDFWDSIFKLAKEDL